MFHNFFLLLWLLFAFPIFITSNSLPIVVLHGVASSATNMDVFSQWLRETFDRKVYNIEIGNGEENSLFMTLDKQLDLLCNTLYSNENLRAGFDFIGMSQGGLLARGYVEQCNNFPVRNLINMVSPNGGVYQPLKIDLYTVFYQSHLSISGYWRDPSNLDAYLQKCSYLPVLNNERKTALSPQHKKNMISLANYVVIWSPLDEVVKPAASGKFGVYDTDYNVIPVQETAMYIEDWLGLRTLAEREGFRVYETNCTHTQHRDPVCFGQLYPIFKMFL
jgi:palmitoyl-protein thioesterase